MRAGILSGATLVALGVCLAITGCGGGGAAPPPPPPAPTISSISPSSAVVGGADFTLTVNGSNFVSGAVVEWNSSNLVTTFVSPNQLTANVPASDLAQAGTAQVVVAAPPPGNQVSTAAQFTVKNAAPTISSLSPASTLVGSPDFTLTVNGTGFVQGSLIEWNGLGLGPKTNFVSSTQLNAIVSTALVQSAGTAAVTVVNPMPGGGPSNSIDYAINNPAPVLTSLSPADIQAGAAPFLLIINGTGFVGGSTVQWNGTSRAVVSSSPTQLATSISASDVAAAGSAQVTVANPAPGGGTSSPLTFTIDPSTSNPLPAITALSDLEAPAGWPGFPIVATGTGFVAASVLQISGVNLQTNVLLSTELVGKVPANDLAAPGVLQFDVFNPAPGGGSSNQFGFTTVPVSATAVGVIERSSMATDLTQPDNLSSVNAISADGRFVVFTSFADNLVSADTNMANDVFLRDTCVGAPAGCTPSTTRASLASDGSEANGPSQNGAISADGRFIAFSSVAGNIVANDTNALTDVFLRDTCFGAPSECTPSTIRVSVASDGSEANGISDNPAISADGRYIAFVSSATNLVSGHSSGTSDIYLRDTCFGAPSGCTPSTVLVSTSQAGGQANGSSESPAISATGRFVAFASSATNLVASDANGSTEDVFVRDTCNGASSGCQPSTSLVSLNVQGQQFNFDSFSPSTSADGRFVAFSEGFSDYYTFDFDVMLRDTCAEAASGCTPNTIAITSSGFGFNPAISADSRFVAYDDSDNVVVLDTCFSALSGCTPQTVLVSVSLLGARANTASGLPFLTAHGSYVAFQSSASNLGPGDTNNTQDVFLARTGFNLPSASASLTSKFLEKNTLADLQSRPGIKTRRAER